MEAKGYNLTSNVICFLEIHRNGVPVLSFMCVNTKWKWQVLVLLSGCSAQWDVFSGISTKTRSELYNFIIFRVFRLEVWMPHLCRLVNQFPIGFRQERTHPIFLDVEHPQVGEKGVFTSRWYNEMMIYFVAQTYQKYFVSFGRLSNWNFGHNFLLMRLVNINSSSYASKLHP